MTKAHIHAELMKQYAEDALETDEPWKRWQRRRISAISAETWHPMDVNPTWSENFNYRRTLQTITINGHEVPKPYRGELKKGQSYFLIDLTQFGEMVMNFHCHECGPDERWMSLGLIHLTREAAQAHVEALLSFTAESDEGVA